MIRELYPVCDVGRRVPLLGNEDIVYTEHRPECGVACAKPTPCLDERVLQVVAYAMVGVRHRIVVKIPAHERLNRALLNMREHIIDLLGTADDGPAVFVLRFLQDLAITGHGLPDVRHRYGITLKVAVIYPKLTST